MKKNSTEQQEPSIAQQNAELRIIGIKEAREKSLPRYFTGKPCKNGHVDERLLSTRCCITCIRERARKLKGTRADYFSEYYRSESYKSRKKLLTKKPANKRRKNERAKELYYEQHEKSKAVAISKYYSMSSEQIASKNKVRRKLLRSSPEARMAMGMRNMLFRCLRLTGRKKSTRTEPALGYSKSDLVKHLESLFKDGMSWENYGSYWEVDHIRPVSKMIKEGIADMKIINSLNNLQPLTVVENREKSDKDDRND